MLVYSTFKQGIKLEGMINNINNNTSSFSSLPHLVKKMNVIPSILVLASFMLVIGTLGYTERNFTQSLDHFDTKKNITFQQRVLVDDTQWNGAKDRPIFVFLGAAKPVDDSLPQRTVLLNQLAQQFTAIVIYIEHRYYGQSVPFEDIEKAMADKQVRACLTIEQSLEDFKTIILSFKSNMSFHHSPVVVFGTGYSGALAAYFRIKYPHVTIGALASSAPMFLIGTSSPRYSYCPIVSQDFEDFNRTCYQIIKDSWKKLDDIASQIGGLSRLSQLFKTCRPIQSVHEIKQELARLYSFAAQYDDPTDHSWLHSVCDSIDQDRGGMEGVAEALTTTLGYEYCYENDIYNLHSPFDIVDSNKTIAWDWQRCNEIIFPLACGDGTMLPPQDFNLTKFEIDCQSRFDVMPNLNFLQTNFGNKDIKEILRRNGSNIIFSNGLRDRFSGEGILENLSESILAIKATEGTYQLDLGIEYSEDPSWLVEQRQKESKIIQQWIDPLESQENNVGPKNVHSSPYLNIFFWFACVLLISYVLFLL